ncbi:hypothetical protein G9A89_013560 [Geosiphon pyriformis]|nr:hypothetical protein G9A89_013560 [Geosiphon pyriformis]
MNKAKSKKVANVTFPIVANKVSTRKNLSVIEAAKQNILATFLLKNISEKLPLAASGSFSSPLAGSSFPVKVPSKRNTQVSPSVVFTTSKSPKIFNNRPVNTTSTTTTTTASQMATKAKNSKKQQQAVTTVMVTPNPFVVPDEIFGKISTVAASPLPNMDGNSSSTSPKIGQDQPLTVLPDVVLSSRSLPIPVAKQPINLDDLKNWADQMEMESTVSPPVSGAANGSVWENVNGYQRFSSWVASNLVSGTTFKIKMALLDAVKLFCVEFASQESLNGATKVAISDKIAWSSGVASVFSSSLSVVLCNVPLDTSSDDIKTALGVFGVVTSVKLKPAGLWQYTVVNFKDISSTAAALSNWSVLVRKNSIRILLITNQKEVISSRDAFKAKLVNLLFGCTAFEISDLVFQETPGCHHCYRCQDLNHLAVDCKKLPLLSPKLSSNTFDDPKNFKSSFVGSKSYAKAAVADMNLDIGGLPKTVTPMLPAVPSVPNSAVESWLAFLESHLSELSVLIKSLVKPVGALVALVTKLLSTPSAMDVSVNKCVNRLAKQNKGLAAVAIVMQKRMTHLEKICEQICLENRSDVDDMVDDPPDFEYLNYQIHIWIAAHQLSKTPFETEKKSYQTAPVFDLFLSESKHSTKTATPEPMANNPMQQNILIALQSIQTALGAATANQYDNKYKFQIIGGYLQDSSATWFSQETNTNA